MNVPTGAGTPGWRAAYRLAAVCAVLPLAALVFDIAVTALYGAAPSGDRRAAEWFALFRDHPLLGLQGLSFPQVVTTALAIPFFCGLYGALRGGSPGMALAAAAVFLCGAAVFLANNAALPMWDLSRAYYAAPGEGERAALAAAGEALIIRGTDFTPAGFLSFFLPGAAGLAMAALSAGAPGFNRALGWTGTIGYALLLAFTVGACWIPGAFSVLMPLSILGGLGVMAWDLGASIFLWRLGSGRA